MKKSYNSESLDFFTWFRKNYTEIIIFILFIYLFFAFLAPLLMHWGYSKTGDFLYTVYSRFCHQLAQRSFFLFGEQSFYPANTHGLINIKSSYDAFGVKPDDIQGSRHIIGNKIYGFKVAICQRDVMLYFAVLLFATIFHFSHNRINKLPLLVWFIVGVLPIGIDGIWQLLSTLNILNFPKHESTPLIRSISGALFGFLSGWYLLPAIQETFNDEDNGTLK